MTLKEKLELLWKYLLLGVLVYGFFELGHSRPGPFPHPFPGGPPHPAVWFSGDDGPEDMDIDVEVTRDADGDSTVVVTVNGEKLDDLDDDNIHVIVKTLGDDENLEKRVKVIKKIKRK